MDGSLTRRPSSSPVAELNYGSAPAGFGKPEVEQAPAQDDTFVPDPSAAGLDGSLELAPAGSGTSEPAEAARKESLGAALAAAAPVDSLEQAPAGSARWVPAPRGG